MDSGSGKQRVARSVVGGFTLIEVMIVVAIVAILAAVAHASYSNHITKTRRAAGASCVLEVAQFMERYYTTNLSYLNADLPKNQCRNDLAEHYTLELDGLSASTYTVRAVPIGPQLQRDEKCGTLSIDQAGTKGKTGSATSVGECW